MKKYLKILIAPAVIIAAFAVLGILWKVLDLPSGETLIPLLKTYFDQYGILLVFVGAILESAFVVGAYAPGSTVIFLGVILSAGNPKQAVLTVASVIAGFLIGFTIDFLLGKYGWHRFFMHLGFKKMLENMQARIKKYGLSIPWVGYHHPDLGSLIATAYGVLQYPYRKFLLISAPPIIMWCTFWGILVYILGDKAFNIFGWKALLIVLGIWIIARIIETKFEEKTPTPAI